MTKIRIVGKQTGQSRSDITIWSRSDSNTEISAGDLHDRAERTAQIIDAEVQSRPQQSTVLFVLSNPMDTARLALDEEFRGVDLALQQGTHREEFVLQPVMAARPSDLSLALDRFEPAIVHFSGHGLEDGRLVFAELNGSATVRMEAVAEALRAARTPVRLVFLNACHSEAEVEVLMGAVPCTITMAEPVADDVACLFAKEFYSGLAFGSPAQLAFNRAVAALKLAGQKHSAPVLRSRPGEKPGDLTFVPSRRR